MMGPGPFTCKSVASSLWINPRVTEVIDQKLISPSALRGLRQMVFCCKAFDLYSIWHVGSLNSFLHSLSRLQLIDFCRLFDEKYFVQDLWIFIVDLHLQLRSRNDGMLLQRMLSILSEIDKPSNQVKHELPKPVNQLNFIFLILHFCPSSLQTLFSIYDRLDLIFDSHVSNFGEKQPKLRYYLGIWVLAIFVLFSFLATYYLVMLLIRINICKDMF